MGERTLEKGFYGSVGMSDPLCAFEDITLRVAWDFGKKAVPENKTIPLMQLPKGFMIDRISVIQTKFADQAVNLTFGLASDDTKLVGGTFALAASTTLLRSSQAAVGGAQPAVSTTLSGTVDTSTGSVANVTATSTASGGSGAGSLLVDSDDVLCMIVPDGLTNDKVSAGAFDLCLKGYRVFSEGLTANPMEVDAYRASLQTAADDALNKGPDGQWPLD